MPEKPQEVIVKNRNTASVTLGITAVVCGALALAGGWIPFLGLLAIPIELLSNLVYGMVLIRRRACMDRCDGLIRFH